jgi:hypothetical protein
MILVPMHHDLCLHALSSSLEAAALHLDPFVPVKRVPLQAPPDGDFKPAATEVCPAQPGSPHMSRGQYATTAVPDLLWREGQRNRFLDGEHCRGDSALPSKRRGDSCIEPHNFFHAE